MYLLEVNETQNHSQMQMLAWHHCRMKKEITASLPTFVNGLGDIDPLSGTKRAQSEREQELFQRMLTFENAVNTGSF